MCNLSSNSSSTVSTRKDTQEFQYMIAGKHKSSTCFRKEIELLVYLPPLIALERWNIQTFLFFSKEYLKIKHTMILRKDDNSHS
jgi:hypothetical protein